MYAPQRPCRIFPHHPLYSAWQEQLLEAAHTPEVRQQLTERQHELLPRFADYYRTLQHLPRRLRRSLQRQWKQSLAGMALLLTLGQAPALAATINVNAGCSLVNAITAANRDTATGGCLAGTGADTIALPASSVQTLTAVNNSSSFGPNGLPLITSNITVAGNGSTIARAGEAPDFRILEVTRSGNLTLQQTIVSGGGAPDPANSSAYGGGVFNNRGNVTLINSTVSGNSAYRGGGINNYRGTMTLTNSTVSDNSVPIGNGNHLGGGVFNRGVMIMTDSTVSGNSARYGGGIVSLDTYGDGSTITMTNSTVSDNFARGSDGGVTNEGTMTIMNSKLTDNFAYFYNGGVNNFGTLTVTNSTISGNSAAERRGGINNLGTMTMINSTVSGNSSYAYGGVNNDGILTMINSTVSGNSASFRFSGVFNDTTGTMTLSRTLISGNIGQFSEVLSRGTININDFNLFGHSGQTNGQAFYGFTPGATDLTATSDGTIPTALSAILNTTLADNGGPTQTHALVSGSPAVDTAGSTCSATDQRGFVRPVDGEGNGTASCDIGAFEFLAAPPCHPPCVTV